MLDSSLPLALPGLVAADAPDAPRDPRPRDATALYREVDRMMTTLVRSLEVKQQQRA